MSLPLSYTNTDISVPLCGPGVDFKHTHKEMIWTAHSLYAITNFADPSGGSTLYQKVNITGVVWYNDAPVEVAGGIGIVEVYHR